MKTHKIKTHKHKHRENAGKQQITSENKGMPTMKTFLNKWKFLDNLNDRLNLFLKKYLTPWNLKHCNSSIQFNSIFNL